MHVTSGRHMRIVYLLFTITAISSSSHPLLDPLRFPQPGDSILPVGDSFYRVRSFLDRGSSTRVFLADKVSVAQIPSDQVYAPPTEGGQILPVALPTTIVIKCLSTTLPRLFANIDNEFGTYSELNKHQYVRKPLGLYLSPRWTCPSGLQQCQYIAMTYINFDLERLVGGGNIRLRPPEVIGATKTNHEGIYSFEVFFLSLGIGIVDAVISLHKAGYVHRDLWACNLALEFPDHDHVVILDLGSSRALRQFSAEEQERLKAEDYHQIHRMLMKLLSSRIEASHGGPKESVLEYVMREIEGKGRDPMINSFKEALSRDYNASPDGNEVIYQQVF